jgi:hypothetical protein
MLKQNFLLYFSKAAHRVESMFMIRDFCFHSVNIYSFARRIFSL